MKPLHVSANNGHHRKATNTQRKCFTYITCMLSCMGYTSLKIVKIDLLKLITYKDMLHSEKNSKPKYIWEDILYEESLLYWLYVMYFHSWYQLRVPCHGSLEQRDARRGWRRGVRQRAMESSVCGLVWTELHSSRHGLRLLCWEWTNSMRRQQKLAERRNVNNNPPFILF
jgi:hypothetical protein